MEIKSNENNNVEKIVNEENKAYTTCPDCGSPISFENDGGNGFCKNCTPNH